MLCRIVPIGNRFAIKRDDGLFWSTHLTWDRNVQHCMLYRTSADAQADMDRFQWTKPA